MKLGIAVFIILPDIYVGKKREIFFLINGVLYPNAIRLVLNQPADLIDFHLYAKVDTPESPASSLAYSIPIYNGYSSVDASV